MTAYDVSVIIPTHNGSKTIAAAIASIRAQEGVHEIIVVDDGSTDETASILETFANVIVVRQENRGPAAARNAGVLRASAPIIGFLDDDDLWCPGKLAQQLEVLATHPDALATLGHSALVRDGDTSVPEPRFLYLVGAVLVRREGFQRVGMFDETLQASEDVDWFLRFRDAGLEMIVTSGIVLFVRRNAENMTHGRSLHDLGIHAVMKRSLDRRRRLRG